MQMQLIFAGDTPDDPLRWAVAREGSVIRSDVSASLADYAATAHNPDLETMLILKGEPFVARQISSPAKSRQQFLQSARFLLEDDLGSGVEDLHVCAVEARGADERTVIAVEKNLLQDWISAAAGLGIRADSVTADFLCLSLEETAAVILTDNGRLLYNFKGEGFAVEEAFARDLVPGLLDVKSVPKVILLSRSSDPVLNAADIELEHFQIKDETTLTDFYTANIHKAGPVNILQGEFEPGIDWLEHLRPWRLAGAMIAACLVLFFATLLGEAVRFNAAADSITAQAEDKFRVAYPDLPIRNLRNQAQQLAGAIDGSQSRFLLLSARLTASLEELGGAELSLLTYQQDGTLIADLQFSTIDDLDRLKEALTQYGLQVDEGRSLTPAGNGYSGRLTIRGAA
ncbi:type II secretion system protein GspL [Parvularcula sp. IMCC14364]|uniref:type II secretion system protein GspL n=1 Tax=Parvularcula sp. IMCC14364 TaxID=3067902 RepID=UPI0027425CE2|nr:type II secretion system protein GspL [Parvularcula sp. IMCC14364]